MDSYSLLPENEYKEVEGRSYLNPTLGVTQTNDFINNLRENQKMQNAQIVAQTQNLGTNIPSNLGGLTGGTGYWTSRYQTPQTNTATANLRAAAQADALNTALANEKALMQKRYQDAYRAQQKSAYDKSISGSGSGSSGSSSGNGLGYDVNGDDNSGNVSVPANLKIGAYTPVTSKMGYFLGSDGRVWQLGVPTTTEVAWNLGITPLIGSHFDDVRSVTENGTVVNKLGKTFMFIKDASHPNGAWYTARSLGSY